MTAAEIEGSTSTGSGVFDQQYTDAKSSLLVPFNMYSSSVNTGYISEYSDQFGIDFTNMHDDKYGPSAEIPMQGPFTEKYVGGSQHRHQPIATPGTNWLNRPEAWHLQSFLDNFQAGFERLIEEQFAYDSLTPTSDVNLATGVPFGSTSPDPSPTDKWTNGVNADNKWSFISGSTPSAGTGPDNSHSSTGFIRSKF
jgi:enamine deaminase RidA (YjgF/YER057c/UK114 family)